MQANSYTIFFVITLSSIINSIKFLSSNFIFLFNRHFSFIFYKIHFIFYRNYSLKDKITQLFFHIIILLFYLFYFLLDFSLLIDLFKLCKLCASSFQESLITHIFAFIDSFPYFYTYYAIYNIWNFISSLSLITILKFSMKKYEIFLLKPNCFIHILMSITLSYIQFLVNLSTF